jgi:hypothetical protein
VDYISTIDEPTGSGNRYLSDKVMRSACDWLMIVTLHGSCHCEAVKRNLWFGRHCRAILCINIYDVKKFSYSWREHLANLFDSYYLYMGIMHKNCYINGFIVEIIDIKAVE